MSFAVDTESLREFAGFLRYYGSDADLLQSFYTKNTEMGVQEQGLLFTLLNAHGNVLMGMRIRTALMEVCGISSGNEVDAAAFFYENQETEISADLDAAYDEVSPPKLEEPSGDSASAGFDYAMATADLKLDGKVADLEPKATEIEDFCRKFLDVFSIAANVRAVLNELVGYDPIEWCIQWFVGDWKAFARCALTWSACEGAVNDMADNFTPALSSLQDVWQGNAANAALDYFATLQQATYTEATAFGVLSQMYKVQVEYVHEATTTLSDIFNAMIDTVLDLLLLAGPSEVLDIGFLFGLTETSVTIQRLWDLVGQAGAIVTAVLDVGKMFETVMAAMDLPDLPACELTGLPREDTSPGYQHPAPTVL